MYYRGLVLNNFSFFFFSLYNLNFILRLILQNMSTGETEMCFREYKLFFFFFININVYNKL